MAPTEKSWPDWKYPKWRDYNSVLTVQQWMDGRRQEDGAEGLWRVNDNLYDLSTWVHSHPGGSEWLTVTKGTDITEAFEVHHLSPLASKILAQFYVRPANTPRNSVLTFKPNGFYSTMKLRVYEKLKNTKPGPTRQSNIVIDSLATTTIVLSILAAIYKSSILVALAGVSLTQTCVVAHNYFHMRDNWRMYWFNMSLLTVREWRISHALSHHLYPNTHYDLEISMFEPLLQFLPNKEKSKSLALLSAICSPIIYCTIYYVSLLTRLLNTQPQTQDLMGVLLPTIMVVIGKVPITDAIITWVFIIAVGSFCFGVVGLNAAHHHPDIFHYGDKPRVDRDWGLFMLDTTRDRVEVSSSPYLVLTTFGDHTLHHLFPTIDHSHLQSLYPILEQTCKEFGIEFKMKTTWDLVSGQFRQLMRNEPNLCDRTDIK